MPSTDATVRAERSRVLIVGGGFGGICAARALKRAEVDVTVLDRGTTNLFQPLLYQCATGLLSEGQITQPIRSMLRRQRNVRVLLGEATSLDPGARVVTATRLDGSTYEVGYDYLVIAAGARQSYFGHDELTAYAPGMKTLDDALTIRRRVYGTFEEAETLADPQARAARLTIAVVGGGPTGVELAGQIKELARRTLRGEFDAIDPGSVDVHLFDGGDAPVASFGPELAGRALTTLHKLGVQTHFGVEVTDVDADGITVKAKDGTTTAYPVKTVFWTAGVEGVPFVRQAGHALGAPVSKGGKIAVGSDLAVAGHENVFVVGDVMDHADLPGLAEVAMQGGRHVGRVIRRERAGKAGARTDFRYVDLGTAAYVARYHALVKVGPIKLSGFVGWILWGLIHIAFLAGIRNRVGALTSWLLTIGRNRRRERAVTYREVDAAAFPYPDDRRAVEVD